MTQPLTDKIEALKTLLPLLWCHLSLLPGSRTVQRYGDATVEPGPPSPAWVTLDCDGVCDTCDYGPQSADRCRGEAWERMACYLDRAYGMGKVRHAYDRLEQARPWMYRAVKLVYVEPVDERSECVSVEARIMRKRVADDGVEWMAAEIRGELVCFGERKRTMRELVEAMLKHGETRTGRITSALGCDSSYVRRIKRALEDAVSV